jgi:hypothetical protein
VQVGPDPDKDAVVDSNARGPRIQQPVDGPLGRQRGDRLVQRHGVDAAVVRQRVVDLTEGGELPEPVPLPVDEPAWPAELDPAPGLERAPTPEGRDPRRRRPWGSAVFADADGKTFRYGIALRQYVIDRDGNPVLTAYGRPVHLLVNEYGEEVRDAEGRSIGAVEIPPGCARWPPPMARSWRESCCAMQCAGGTPGYSWSGASVGVPRCSA